jgi:uncharacterized protein YbbC (DUF1343 family)
MNAHRPLIDRRTALGGILGVAGASMVSCVSASTESSGRPSSSPAAAADAPAGEPSASPICTPASGERVATGVERLTGSGWAEISGQRVGVLSNHTGVMPGLVHEVDVMAEADEVDLVTVFGPEHGFRGAANAEAPEAGFTDPKTGLEVHNIYLTSSDEQAQLFQDTGVETVVFDIQDIGTRFYTFIWQLYDAMVAAAQAEVRFVVLDRPNPLGGRAASGPMLDPELSSFVGREPIALRHGMTVGELAQLFNGEFILARAGRAVDLTVVEMTGWDRSMSFEQTGLDTWVLPSPNIPTVDTAYAYPGLGLLEGTNLSEGRGTTRPFELIGAPWADFEWGAALRELGLPGVAFRDAYIKPTFSKYEGQVCPGVGIHVQDRSEFDPIATGVAALVTAWDLYEQTELTSGVDRLSGSTALRTMIEAGASVDEIVGSWESDLAVFEQVRQQYLLY